MSVAKQTLFGFSLVVLSLTWNLIHRHQSATHRTDVMVVLGILGALISLHASYRRAVRWHR